jgi:hypothetical protein
MLKLFLNYIKPSFLQLIQIINSKKCIALTGYIFGVLTTLSAKKIKEQPLITGLQQNLNGILYAFTTIAISNNIPEKFRFIVPLIIFSACYYDTFIWKNREIKYIAPENNYDTDGIELDI